MLCEARLLPTKHTYRTPDLLGPWGVKEDTPDVNLHVLFPTHCDTHRGRRLHRRIHGQLDAFATRNKAVIDKELLVRTDLDGLARGR
jgi:hypothetical protein